jgi:hypothetical protein
MPVEVIVYQVGFKRRSRIVAAAMMKGIARSGDQSALMDEKLYRRGRSRIAVFYGLHGNLAAALRAQRQEGGIAVYIDLGYWGRRIDDNRYTGFHKVVVNARHPTAYLDARRHDGSRAAALGVKPKPWRKSGRRILLAGMGPKAAEAEGMKPLDWERRAIETLRGHTDRPIVFRPKPNVAHAFPLDGADYSPPEQTLEDALADCHAVVAHHSNVCVDGLVDGIPAFCVEGAALPMGSSDLSTIESPARPGSRRQWVADLAWTQWSVAEMAEGLPWRHLKDEGLV